VKAPLGSLDMELSISYCSIVFLNRYTIALSKIIYYFTMFAGLIGGLLILIRFRKFPIPLLFTAIPVYSIVIHGLILRIGENRYIVPTYPFIVVCAAYGIYCLYVNVYKLGKRNNE